MQAAGCNATSSMTPPRWVLPAHGDLDYPPNRTAAYLLDPITQMAIRAGARSGYGRFITEQYVRWPVAWLRQANGARFGVPCALTAHDDAELKIITVARRTLRARVAIRMAA